MFISSNGVQLFSGRPMPEIVVFKDSAGKLAGHGEKGARAYQRFLAQVRELPHGGTLAFSWRAPRSPQLHRFFFALLGELFERQEFFASSDDLRAWLTVGAGYVHWVQGPNGPIAMPQSIAFDKLDEDEFRGVIDAVKGFLWAPYAQSTLWPHLSPEQRYEAVEALRLEFDR